MQSSRPSRKKSYQFGHHAETMAVWYLRLVGYRVLVRRYKSYVGEVDIVAKRGKWLVFVEVKARKRGNSAEVLSKHQQQRITRAASAFLAQYPHYAKSSIRFDLILLSPALWLRHIKNAWC